MMVLKLGSSQNGVYQMITWFVYGVGAVHKLLMLVGARVTSPDAPDQKASVSLSSRSHSSQELAVGTLVLVYAENRSHPEHVSCLLQLLEPLLGR